ncbi:hypothetical protein O181_028889 [Austropuccinia psidii MF-1]|uniref:Glycoside hydrolase family 2 protein n=1 Tax=Austropuccinia psidii MF-1 TaxID=1389203 RepID=A0A9Q3H421_9BASI|nr:hypothetical protein [Austropuccinia psidii MF-1]
MHHLFILNILFSLNCIAPTLAALPNCTRSAPYQLKTPPLTTNWTSQVGSSPWQEYPRPLLRRDKWLNLNGVWQFKAANNSDQLRNPPFGGCDFDREILVPFPMESGLSGIMENHMYSWYRKTFVINQTWTENVTINFGAVDYEATVFVNRKQAGFHRGGYFRFTLDVTEVLKKPGQENELLVFVYDPTTSNNTLIPLGKQALQISHIFYTPSSGIWQTVFLEPVPKEHIVGIDINADMNGIVKGRIATSVSSQTALKIIVFPPTISSPQSPLYPKISGAPILEIRQTANTAFQFKIDSPQLWSPTKPYLYHFRVEMGQDVVESYLGFRTIEKKKDEKGILRPFLNGEFVFQFGPLDQGFWPDGLHTAPTFEAMQYDLVILKQLGFNVLRKHIKIEPDLYYYACDRIGLMVWQDMPSLSPGLPKPTEDQQKEFVRQLNLMVTSHISFPSIIVWVIYNEGWGQPDSGPEVQLAPMVKQMDPSRLVVGASGWTDHGAGDFDDRHRYSSPLCGMPIYNSGWKPYDTSRIGVQGEFGGIGHVPSKENLWNVPDAIKTINETYELTPTLEVWNYRTLRVVEELKEQATLFSCSGGIYTQTTDVEGEVNGFMTYDRRILRADVKRWNQLMTELYAVPKGRNKSRVG